MTVAITCSDFREHLARVLSGPAGEAEWSELSWHEHLLGCEACRALLEEEHALELLLESLPSPSLPPDMAARLLRRLHVELERESALDELLELERAPRAPADLGDRVLDALRDERAIGEPPEAIPDARIETTLERLLDRLPSPKPPLNLAQRVLEGIGDERDALREAFEAGRQAAGGTRGRKLRPVEKRAQDRKGSLARTAALWLFFLGSIATIAWLVEPEALEHMLGAEGEATAEVAAGEGGAPAAGGDAPEEAAPAGERAAETPALPPEDEALLASLDVLENWEMLRGEDLDLLLASIDLVDELLLELEDEVPAAAAPDEASRGEEGSAG